MTICFRNPLCGILQLGTQWRVLDASVSRLRPLAFVSFISRCFPCGEYLENIPQLSRVVFCLSLPPRGDRQVIYT